MAFCYYETNMLKKLARTSYRHRWIVLAIWVAILVGINFAATHYGDNFSSQFRTSKTDSQQAVDILQQRFPALAGGTGQIVFKVPTGATDMNIQMDMDYIFAEVLKVPHVSGIVSPFTPAGAQQVSRDGQIAYAQIQFDQSGEAIPQSSVKQIRDIVASNQIKGVEIELGGDIFQTQMKPGNSELYGIIAAIFILLISFGSVLAMGLPITMALFGIGIGVAFVKLLSHFIALPDITIELASMIGIGVGIDYALFIVTRYRQNLEEGRDPEQAVVKAIDTAGRSVLFAGTTVVISLLGMVLIGVSFISGMGIGSATVVLITMLASITLLPAILGFVGLKIDSLRLPHFGKTKTKEHSVWYRWSRFLQRNPWPAMVLSLGFLLILTIPLFSMRLGSSDASSRPTSDTTRRAYDLIGQGFGVGANGPLLLVAELPAGQANQSMAELTEFKAKLAAMPGVQSVSPAVPNQQMTAAVMQVIPTTSPQDQATSQLIKSIRQVAPANVHVGGITASFDDLADLLQSRLPLFIGIVLVLSFILLLVVFRSVLVPLKAVIMNLLSIGAAYGVLVAVFQWGYGSSLLGLGHTGPIESFVPMIMFAILFGLSMDYEVFLLSRIKEEYDRTGDNATAVADGLNYTARVITAAAAIMVTVFASFVLNDNRIIKEFGLGLAVAVLLDASIVRMILVPSSMELLGKANWWFPRWLNWLPKLHIDGAAEDEPTPPAKPSRKSGKSRTKR